MDKIKSRKKLHLSDFDYKGSAFVYFITICTANKQPYFSNDKIAKVIVDEMEFRRINKEIRLFCYCIMLDHLHILLSLTDDYQKKLQDWVSAFKRYTAKIINELFDIKPLWQKNFYDHIVRKEESLLKISEYIVNNPARKGMVSNWEEYPYSKMVDPLPWIGVNMGNKTCRVCFPTHQKGLMPLSVHVLMPVLGNGHYIWVVIQNM